MLDKADNYITTRQYDKAIATAENALDLDPHNGAAKAMLARARARQMDVLKTGSSLE